jgi:hypothetical protein
MATEVLLLWEKLLLNWESPCKPRPKTLVRNPSLIHVPTAKHHCLTCCHSCHSCRLRQTGCCRHQHSTARSSRPDCEYAVWGCDCCQLQSITACCVTARPPPAVCKPLTQGWLEHRQPCKPPLCDTWFVNRVAGIYCDCSCILIRLLLSWFNAPHELHDSSALHSAQPPTASSHIAARLWPEARACLLLPQWAVVWVQQRTAEAAQ